MAASLWHRTQHRHAGAAIESTDRSEDNGGHDRMQTLLEHRFVLSLGLRAVVGAIDCSSGRFQETPPLWQ
jgi:hypothetical protein